MMTKRDALANKILLLGVDGMDPRLTRKYVDEGYMPNVKQYIERGRPSATNLGDAGRSSYSHTADVDDSSCGCYANVHGITGFFRKGNDIDEIDYNIDSRLCKAEQLWNVLAEAGKKTLVWHWPGSAWPPSSDNPNLFVVDGTGLLASSMARWPWSIRNFWSALPKNSPKSASFPKLLWKPAQPA